jgi:hypothetical protein
MRIRKSVAGLGAAALAITGIGVMAAPSALAASQNDVVLNGSPVNLAGTASYVGTPDITLTAVQNGANVDVTVSVSEGPTTTSFSGFAAGAYRLDAYVRVDGGPQVQLVGTPGVPAVDVSSVSYPGGTSATASIPGLTVGSHTIVLQSLVLDSSGGLSGGFATSFATLQGFDAVYNLGTTTGDIVANPPVAPIGLTETIAVIGPQITINSVTNTGADNASGGGDDTVVTGAIVDNGSGDTAYFRDKDVLAFSGNNQWNNNGNFWVRVCATAAGTGCAPHVVRVAEPVTAATVTTGTLNASAYLMSTGGFTGAQYLQVEQHAVACVWSDGAIPGDPSDNSNSCNPGTIVKKASFPVNILGTRSISAPTTVSPTVSFAVTGSNWYPGETVTVAGNVAAGGDVNGAPAATGVGGISTTVTLGATTTASSVVATGIDGSASSPILLSKDQCTRQVGSGTLQTCETQQTINATVNAGALTQAAADYDGAGIAYTKTSINIGSVTTSISDQFLPGHINPITVTDVRGGDATWSLTADMPDLAGSGTAAGDAIEDENLVLGAVDCAPSAGSATGITEGGGGNFGGAALTICDASTNADDSAGDNVGGQWVANAPLTLKVPAFQQAGNYSAVITFTLT